MALRERRPYVGSLATLRDIYPGPSRISMSRSEDVYMAGGGNGHIVIRSPGQDWQMRLILCCLHIVSRCSIVCYGRTCAGALPAASLPCMTLKGRAPATSDGLVADMGFRLMSTPTTSSATREKQIQCDSNGELGWGLLARSLASDKAWSSSSIAIERP